MKKILYILICICMTLYIVTLTMQYTKKIGENTEEQIPNNLHINQ